MQAVILCGGRGERLMPLTACRPAGLLRITGDTILNYILKQLKDAGFKKVILAMGYLEGMIISQLERCNFEGLDIKFLSSEMSGTGGSLAQAFDGDDMLVVEANCLFNFNLKKIQAFHTINKALCTIVTKRLTDISDHVCFSADAEGNIKSISQSPANANISSTNAFSGIYLLSKNAFNQLKFSNGSDFVSEILPLIIANQKVISYSEKGYWCKITEQHGFLQAQYDMLSEKTGLRIACDFEKDGIYSNTASNFNGVSVTGPVYIGKNVTIDEGAVIQPFSVLDDNCVVGSRACINASYVGKGATVSPRCEISKAVICNNALIKQSVHCGEYSVIGEKAVIGDGATIEDNIKIWAAKEVAANSVINKHIIVGSGRIITFDDNGEFNFGSAMNAPIEFASMGMAIGSSFDKKSIILVGYSATKAADILCDSLIAGIASTGACVLFMGQCTNQQIIYCTTRFSCNAGCYICTECGNRIKVYDKGGLPLTRQIERQIENSYNLRSFRPLDCRKYGIRYDISGAKALYKIYLDSLLPQKFSGINAAIRTSYKEIAYLADEIFHQRNDIDGETIIFHISADGASCSAYTEKTGYVFHERLILLAILACFEKNVSVCVPFSFPIEADRLAQAKGKKLLRYYNSPDNDSDRIARLTAQRADNLFVRDGLALVCVICSYLSEKNLTFSEALKSIPKFSTVQRFVSTKGNPTELTVAFSNKMAGSNEGVVFENNGARALIRPLKNGGGLMIFAESFKSESASAICDEIQQKLKEYEN